MELKEKLLFVKNNEYLHYANCYEDSQTLYDFKKPGRYLSVCSGLDNSLALLADDVEEMVVFDYNYLQIYYAKLKFTAYKYLDYQDLLVFLGINVEESKTRTELFESLKPFLEPAVRTYFGENLEIITKTKLINAGKFEKYLNLFAKKVLPFVETRRTIIAFLAADTLSEQQRIYNKKWNNIRFKLAFRIFFSKRVMAKLGRDQTYFKYLEKKLAKNLKQRIEVGFNNVLNKNNCYLQYMLLQNFDAVLPDYLKLENYERIKRNLFKIKFVETDFLSLINLKQRFDYLNLSDIFEYVSLEKMSEYEDVLDQISCSNAHIIFWNMMVERRLTNPKFKELPSEELLKQERAFLYQKLWRYEKC